MKRKQYKVYSDGVQYNINLGNGDFKILSEKEHWFDIKVTSWKDEGGCIVGTYEFKNIPWRIEQALNSGNLYIAVVRKEAGKMERSTADSFTEWKWWHVDRNSMFLVDSMNGEFLIQQPEMLGSAARAGYIAKLSEQCNDTYQIVQLAVVKKTSPDSDMFNKFVPIPNTKRKIFYFE